MTAKASRDLVCNEEAGPLVPEGGVHRPQSLWLGCVDLGEQMVKGIILGAHSTSLCSLGELRVKQLVSRAWEKISSLAK